MIKCNVFIYDGIRMGGYGFSALSLPIDVDLENKFVEYGFPNPSKKLPSDLMGDIETRMFEIKPGLLCFTRITGEDDSRPKYYTYSILIKKEDFDELNMNVKVLNEKKFYIAPYGFKRISPKLDKIRIYENKRKWLSSMDVRKIKDIFGEKKENLVYLLDSIFRLIKEKKKILIIMEKNPEERIDFFLNLLLCLPDKYRFVPFSTLSVVEKDWDMFDAIIMSKLEENLLKSEKLKICYFNLDEQTAINAHATPLKIAEDIADLIYKENVHDLMKFHESLGEINKVELGISESDVVVEDRPIPMESPDLNLPHDNILYFKKIIEEENAKIAKLFSKIAHKANKIGRGHNLTWRNISGLIFGLILLLGGLIISYQMKLGQFKFVGKSMETVEGYMIQRDTLSNGLLILFLIASIPILIYAVREIVKLKRTN